MKAFDMWNLQAQAELVVVLTLVFLCSLLGTRLMRYLGGRYGWMVLPRADRWHKKPTALHGGVGFFPAFLLGVAWLIARNDSLQWSDVISLSMSEETRLIGAFLSGSFLMFLFGLWDDLKQCRPATKLVFQLVAASLFISAGGVFPLTGIHIVDVLVTYFWFIGITNAVNMLDNMDGLSSGVVILAGCTIVVLALGVVPPDGQPSMTVHVGLVFITALLGFWVFNRPPASIFMGDSGSLFIGYGLAGLAVPSALNGFMGINRGETVLGPVFALLIPATVLAVPIFDTTLVTITRKWKALKATEGGRDHSSHRLVGLGLSEKRTVWLLYSFAAFGGTVAVIMQRFSQEALPLLGLFVIILVLSGVYLGHVKVQRTDVNRMPPVWTPLVTELFYKRRAAEVLLDTVLIVICFYGAYLLRFDGTLPSSTEQAVMVALPLIVPSCLIAYFLSGMYRGQWRFISVSDVPCYVLGVFGGAVFSLASVTLITRFPHGHSRSAYIIFALLVFVAIVGSRLSFRLLDSVFAHNHSDAGPNGRKLVLIYGAARAGKILHDEITSNPELRGYSIIGFIDNDHHLNGRRLCGIPVRSESEWLGQAWHCVPEIWISSKFISDQQGQALAQNWSGLVTVRRVQLHMETIEHAQEQAGPCVVKAIDRDREIFHANSDTVALHTVSQVAHESPITEHA
jgi:UDP-GlcNAc:undecaprenyl-phosphate GlcNAc-1-phosphate transferase